MPRIIEALRLAGPKPAESAGRAAKKAYTERISHRLAPAVSAMLQERGLKGCLPNPRGGTERRYAGGIGAKKVDVSYATPEGGLILAVSIKCIGFRDKKSGNFQKNVPNRKGDMLAEAVTLHKRFPYAVMGGLFLFDHGAHEDGTARRRTTFATAHRLFEPFANRRLPSDAPESYEVFGFILYDVDGNDPKYTYHPLGRPDQPAPLTIFIDSLLERMEERNADHYELVGGRLQAPKARQDQDEDSEEG